VLPAPEEPAQPGGQAQAEEPGRPEEREPGRPEEREPEQVPGTRSPGNSPSRRRSACSSDSSSSSDVRKNRCGSRRHRRGRTSRTLPSKLRVDASGLALSLGVDSMGECGVAPHRVPVTPHREANDWRVGLAQGRSSCLRPDLRPSPDAGCHSATSRPFF
jgi:hypothetical protein